MKDKLLELTGRFDALQPRERMTIGASVLLGGLVFGYLTLIDPQITRQHTQAKRINQLKSELASQEAQIVALKAQLTDPDASTKAELQEIKKSMAAIDVRLHNVQNSLVPPDKMQAFLEGLLVKNGQLELLSLHTLAVAPLIAQPSGTAKPDEKAAPGAAEVKSGRKDVSAAKSESGITNIYKHTIEMRIAGSYNDIAKYLAAIESMPERIVWERADLVVEKHPRCVLTLTVYTLSLDKQWLTV